ncbi:MULTISPECIES: PDC sensor domain-containing protein [unclassified Nitratiruptor]|uniref:PDC sensor domain-containing protein n=1 Tax=unclassified Nitratiruptor TaxID=2624044 RepID=UPI00191598DB|nr:MULTISPECIES: PDC sensor domain-containing protein [unclassified Nitratiruptor]BCD60720.1 N-linked glycosylation glycosyltransferase PglG [Nitratiruptor sp. YY08-10]BCD64652.1 N-linked glycosylation glycosyltransferase PglG [Nitratiruptor sp. YY08-14]
MVVSEIEEFSEIRTKARAYLCFLLQRYIPNYVPDPSLDNIINALKILKKELPLADAFYVLDKTGTQIIDAVSNNPEYRRGKGINRSMRAYYYRAVREKRCILTDPYPSLLTHELTVTASYPIYDERKQLVYIVCVDISLKNLLKMFHPSSIDSHFGQFSKVIYGFFSFALLVVALLLLAKGMGSIIAESLVFQDVEIKEIFESTILITLSLAIFDLVKTLFEEEVLGHHKKRRTNDIHKTMIRFLGSIVIALSIEALMLVFKFAIIGPEKILYAVYLIGAVTLLLLALSYYLKSTADLKEDE